MANRVQEACVPKSYMFNWDHCCYTYGNGHKPELANTSCLTCKFVLNRNLNIMQLPLCPQPCTYTSMGWMCPN